MDDKTNGRIALALIKNQIVKNGARLSPAFRRDIGNLAKEIEILPQDLMDFYESITRELVDEFFCGNKKHEEKLDDSGFFH